MVFDELVPINTGNWTTNLYRRITGQRVVEKCSLNCLITISDALHIYDAFHFWNVKKNLQEKNNIV